MSTGSFLNHSFRATAKSSVMLHATRSWSRLVRQRQDTVSRSQVHVFELSYSVNFSSPITRSCREIYVVKAASIMLSTNAVQKPRASCSSAFNTSQTNIDLKILTSLSGSVLGVPTGVELAVSEVVVVSTPLLVSTLVVVGSSPSVVVVSVGGTSASPFSPVAPSSGLLVPATISSCLISGSSMRTPTVARRLVANSPFKCAVRL